MKLVATIRGSTFLSGKEKGKFCSDLKTNSPTVFRLGIPHFKQGLPFFISSIDPFSSKGAIIKDIVCKVFVFFPFPNFLFYLVFLTSLFVRRKRSLLGPCAAAQHCVLQRLLDLLSRWVLPCLPVDRSTNAFHRLSLRLFFTCDLCGDPVLLEDTLLRRRLRLQAVAKLSFTTASSINKLTFASSARCLLWKRRMLRPRKRRSWPRKRSKTTQRRNLRTLGYRALRQK